MQVAPENSADTEASLQLILFVDERPDSRKPIENIRRYLEQLRADYYFELTIVDVGEQPYLAEHFKIVVTPALVKIYPPPRQVIAGSNLIEQLQHWWPRWHSSAQEQSNDFSPDNGASALPMSSSAYSPEHFAKPSINASVELIRLAEEVFRLKQEKAEVLEQLRFKDQVIAMLAHDLRSPLTAASMAAETLENYSQSSNNGKSSQLTPQLKARLLEQTRSQLRSMDKMITELLQAARGSNCELNVHPHKLNLGRLFRETLAQLHEQFQVKSQQVETDIPQDLPYVYGDRELVRQVIVNLLDNAIKYTPVGGTIKIAALHRTSQKVQVSICDSGPGIPEDDCERIFEDRFRLKRDEAKEGYGLGLSLCQRIVHAHYGRIWADSATHKGGCFHFTLPIYR